MNKQARKQQQPQRSTAASAPRHHGTLTYHKPLIALTANEARLYIQDLKARLAQKMQRERAYLDRRAARGTHTPTDEAYEADVRRIGGGERVQQRLLELMEGSMHTPLTLPLERGRRPEHVGKAA